MYVLEKTNGFPEVWAVFSLCKRPDEAELITEASKALLASKTPLHLCTIENNCLLSVDWTVNTDH